MNLYLLTRTGDPDYDETEAAVVAAVDAAAARKLMATPGAWDYGLNGFGGEGPAAWTDPKRSTIVRISDTATGAARIVLRSFNAG